MSNDDPPPRPWRAILLVLLALYVLSYFPAFSYLIRHPEHQRFSAAYRPLPTVLRHGMFTLWKKIDPAGFQIVDSQAAAHPEDPTAVEALARAREQNLR